jgi:hypothetical protein
MMRQAEAFSLLGVRQVDLDRLRTMPFEVAVRGLKDLQDTVRKNFRRLTLALHPDRTGGDEKKTQKFVEVKAYYEQFMQLRVQRQTPVSVQPIQAFHVVFGGYGFGTTTTASTTTTYGFPTYVVTMRPR